MAAAAVLSMWISNTATTLMLLPVALAVLERAPSPALATPLLLGIAFSASVGGVGTPIGTPPNLIFMQVYENTTGTALSFLDWMGWGVPVVLVMIPVLWLWLTRKLGTLGPVSVPSPGPWRPAEARVLAVFALTALAWITRSEPFGAGAVFWLCPGPATPEWPSSLSSPSSSFPTAPAASFLNWKVAEQIPWGMLLLFAGGITIARGFEATGISEALGTQLSALASFPPVITMAVICLVITFLTEMTSNTATTTLMMPILAAAALGAGLPPELLMVPAAMSASCAFMMPVATAPNAIMFGTGRFTTRTMASEGVVLNLLGAVVITTVLMLVL